MTQAEALDILKLGHNIFLTGPAGSGKTFLLNQYVNYLKKNHIAVAVTASTGIAATHLNGRTIHSWCGMGINDSFNKEQMRSLKDRDEVVFRIKRTKVLIIDEISMLNASRLDLINNICQAVRQNLRPFGGLQVVLSGDFFQLPPVTKQPKEDGRFVVESETWQNMAIKICYLEEQYRQADKVFLQILNNIRNGTVTDETMDCLRVRINQPINSTIRATKLHTHNSDVDAYNTFELNKLAGNKVVYEMTTTGIASLVRNLKDSYCLAPESLAVGIGAIVMFLKNNFNRGYVNGTLGQVVGFDADNGYPVVKTIRGREIIAYPETWLMEDGGEVLASVSQVPLRLAWAITVHKSQGMSLDCAEIDLSKTFEFGMGYVALSRVRSLDGIKLVGINDKALQINEAVIILNKILVEKSRQDLNQHQQCGKRMIKKEQKKFLTDSKGSHSLDL